MLTRIYGTAFTKSRPRKVSCPHPGEAKKRAIERSVKEAGYLHDEEKRTGLPFFLPKGMVLKNALLDYWRDHNKAGYQEISPIMLNRQL